MSDNTSDDEKTPGDVLYEVFNREQARLLLPDAAKNGLCLNVYLLPDTAAWLLEEVGSGRLPSPNHVINQVLAQRAGGQHRRMVVPPENREVQVANSPVFGLDDEVAAGLWQKDRVYLLYGSVGSKEERPATWENARIREATSE